jgi:hypothetical protein
VRQAPATGFSRAVTAALLVLAGLLAVTAADSLRWPYIHDSPLMLYAGWHVAGGGVPYRDLFDMNVPGTYFVMWALGASFGWEPLGFRIFDVLCLSLLAGGTYRWLRRCGRAPAVAASLTFPLWYLAAGPSTSMQREFLALVPLVWLLALGESGLRPPVRYFAAGLLAGAAALIKPQFLLLALPPLARLALVAPPAERERLSALLGTMGAGLGLPFGAAAVFLAHRGGLDAFIDIASGYWPLYAQLSGSHHAISGLDRLRYLAESTLEGVANPYLVPAFAGVWAGFAEARHRSTAWTLAALIAAAALYPAFSGQFWTYHWLPLQFVLLSAASLGLMSSSLARPWGTGNLVRAAAASIVLIAVGSTAVRALVASSSGDPASDVVRSRARARGVPGEVAAFLRTHLRPGDLVQPLDWTGGAVHGMLEARARLATRFMYDFHFYHHVDTPYIARLRRQFVRQLAAARPRFVIRVFDGRPWPAGPGTSREFPALDALLASEYRVVHGGATYDILERIGSPQQEQ